MKLKSMLFISMFGIVWISNLCEAKKYIIQPNVKANWFQASQLCHAKGMKLPTILSDEDKLQVEEAIKNAGAAYTDSDFWTSGTRLGRNDQKFYWSENGQDFKYTAWGSGEPNNVKGNEECVFIEGNYAWFDDPCSRQINVICEENEKECLSQLWTFMKEWF